MYVDRPSLLADVLSLEEDVRRDVAERGPRAEAAAQRDSNPEWNHLYADIPRGVMRLALAPSDKARARSQRLHVRRFRGVAACMKLCFYDPVAGDFPIRDARVSTIRT